MRPLPFVWPYALVFWAVYVWAFLPEWKVVQGGREGVKSADSKDSGSLKVILGGMWMALLLAYPLAFVKAWVFPQGWQLPLFVIGVLMIVLGSLLRRLADAWRILHWRRESEAGPTCHQVGAISLGETSIVYRRDGDVHRNRAGAWQLVELRAAHGCDNCDIQLPGYCRRARAPGNNWRALPQLHEGAEALHTIRRIADQETARGSCINNWDESSVGIGSPFGLSAGTV